MKILAIDTTAKVSSVSIVSDEKILAEYSVNLNLTHSQTAMFMCENILSCCRLTVADLDAFAVSTGPGSFTGLRIGLAAVKGMAYPFQKPCISVSTLDALAQNLSNFSGYVCAVMDARCRQVYNSIYLGNGRDLTKIIPDRACMTEDLLKELKDFKKSVILVGDGADLCYNQYQEAFPEILIAEKNNRFQRASSVGLLAVQKMRRGEILSASEIVPQYLRLPQAERERLKKQKSQPAKSI